jgi:tRNA pseudouridine55 synthase
VGRPNNQARTPVCGILVVDKPAGISSMGVVARVRRWAGGARCGHAGTLDPLATGVLVVGLGRATKVLDRFMRTDKRYATTIDLGAFTATDDREGDREPVEVAVPPAGEAIERALRTFVGSFEQRPPRFSAVKVDGRRAYRVARRGGDLEVAPRRVVVRAIDLVAYEWPLVTVAIDCAKGFYVRSFARDLGRTLGTGGHCATLRRTAVGPFTEAMAIRLDDVPEPLDQTHLIDVDKALSMLA